MEAAMRLSKAVFLHALRSQADARVRLVLAGLLGLREDGRESAGLVVPAGELDFLFGLDDAPLEFRVAGTLGQGFLRGRQAAASVLGR